VPRSTPRIRRVASLTVFALSAVCLAAAPGAASAETLTYTTPATTTVTLPLGVASVHVVAVGGRGGGLAGGFGAVVEGDVRVVSSVPPTPAGSAPQPPELRVTVAGNGGIGAAGFGGGGPAGALGTGGVLLFPTLAGGGGGASVVSVCRVRRLVPRCAFSEAVVAGGGGGAGADGLPGAGGAGGASGSAGRTGTSGGAGTSTPLLTAATGGAGAETGQAGAGSATTDLACEGGTAGRHGSSGDGGAGGLSPDLAGHGDGGGGGAGDSGGGGGGGGGLCNDAGTSGGGGGGGSSQVPIGGRVATDTTGQPFVTISYEIERPAVTVVRPRPGTVYAQGRSLRASYRCSPPRIPQVTIVTCSGPVASGAPFDTSARGLHDFTVRATDSVGGTTEHTVQYRVSDQTRPTIERLRVVPRTIELDAERPFAVVAFRLSEPARVQAMIGRTRAGQARAARVRVRTIAGDAGRNTFRLRPRIRRRTLRTGTYRLTLRAVDAAGNRSLPVGAHFRVAD
jgi:hypothetical protein